MKLLILHHAHYRKMMYHETIDHSVHDVVYAGRPGPMANVPADLRCQRIVIPDGVPLADAVIEATSKADDYDAVLAIGEQGILEAHAIRCHLGLPETDKLDMLERVRDKVIMKQALAGSQIEFPRYVTSLAAGEGLPWQGATVVKPRRGASSVGVEIFASAELALKYYWEHPDPADLEIEEYIDAPIYHADGLVFNGRPEEMVVSRYIGTNTGFEMGITPLGSAQQAFDPERDEFVRSVLSTLEIANGIVHLEFFETSDRRRIFLEIANRLGGGGIAVAHHRQTGYDLPKNDIAIRLGMKRPAPEFRSGRYHGWLIFPGHGIKDQHRGEVEVPDHIRTSPYLDELYVNTDPAIWSRALTFNELSCPVSIAASAENSELLESFLATCVSDIRWGR